MVQILCGWVITVVFNLIYIKLMSQFPKTMSKISILGIDIIMIGIIMKHLIEQSWKAALGALSMFSLFTYQAWKFWPKFELAISIVDCAADFVNSTWRIIIISLFNFL